MKQNDRRIDDEFVAVDVVAVVLRGRAVRCQTKLHVVLWGCGVVVCVCVCFIGRVGPKKLQKSASFANFYQNRTKMGSKSTTNETNMGQGGGKGQPKINENMKKYKKRKRKEAK